jgi:hypothetical protein
MGSRFVTMDVSLHIMTVKILQTVYFQLHIVIYLIGPTFAIKAPFFL